MSLLTLMKSVEEESDNENQLVETNHMGNEPEMEEHEMTPRRSIREQRATSKEIRQCSAI